jgi:hypothetical protein
MKAPPPTHAQLEQAVKELLVALSRCAGRHGGSDLVRVAVPAYLRASLLFGNIELDERDRMMAFWQEEQERLDAWIESNRHDLRALRNLGYRITDEDIEEAEREAQAQAERRKLAVWNALAGKPLADDKVVR